MKNIFLALTGLFLLSSIHSQATVFTAKANGSWSSSSTWSNNSTPGQSDTVVIPSPYTVTSSSSISMGTSSGGKLTINAGGTLNLSSNSLTINNAVVVTINGTLNAGALQLNSTTSLTNTGTITASTSIGLDNSTTFSNTGTVSTGTLTLNKTSVFTDNGAMTITTDIALDDNSDLIVSTGKTINDNGAFDDYSSTKQTDNGAILVSGTATFYGGSSISGTGYLTGGQIQQYDHDSVWSVPKSYFPCTSCTIPHISPLPITLLSFNANYNNDGVQLTWSTATETNNKYFTVSRSTDGVNFTTVTTIEGAGNSESQRDYTCTDMNAPQGLNYYRLQQTDDDGNTTTDAMAIATVNITKGIARVIPNPVKDKCVVTFNDNVDEYFQLSVYDFMGREVVGQLVQSVKGSNAVEINTSALGEGVYIINIPVNAGTTRVKFIKH